MHHAVKQLREQLVQAQAHIRTLEAKLKDTNKPTTDAPAQKIKSPQVVRRGWKIKFNGMGVSSERVHCV